MPRRILNKAVHTLNQGRSPITEIKELVTIIRTPNSMVVYDFVVMVIVVCWAIILNISEDFIETSASLAPMLRIYRSQAHMAFHLGFCVLFVVVFRIYRWRIAYAMASLIRILFWSAIVFATYESGRISSSYAVYGTFIIMDFILMLKILGVIKPPLPDDVTERLEHGTGR